MLNTWHCPLYREEAVDNMSGHINIVRGTNKKPVASQALAHFFSNRNFGGELMFGYPIIGTPDGKHAFDAVWISPEIGIVIFDLIEGGDPGEFDIRQDDAANKLEARLKTDSALTRRRDLLIEIHTISFAPGIWDVDKFAKEDYHLANPNTLEHIIRSLSWRQANRDVFERALSVIQSLSRIRSPGTNRIVQREDSLGSRLKGLEDRIATLDYLQNKAVIETVDGVQRIRGLAGSGKTIVLALKAAYLHAQHPNWRVAVTFNTRSLKGQFKRLINNFSVEHGVEPNWDRLRIVNAWGAPGSDERDGIYHEFCRLHDIEYLPYQDAKFKFGRGNEFEGACEKALAEMQEPKHIYDAILIDEAQDFPPAFLRLCYELLDDKKRLVYAYDELQNLSGHSLPPPEEIFGTHPDGSPRVTLSNTSSGAQQDIILKKCYRNSRPVLVTAHALGFGIYRKPPKTGETGLVQMFEHSKLWEDIGYRVRAGQLRDGAAVSLQRTEEASPKFLEEHSPVNELIEFLKFDSEEEQATWVVNAIIKNLQHDELRHDDIMVINPNPLTTRKRVGLIRRKLLEAEINSHLAGVDTDPDIFFQPNSASITFTGIHRAKGNEAAMVYIINAQDYHASSWNLATIRNRLFTAITRSKAWVRILGIGEGMEALCEEYEELLKRNFELHFTYPTKEQRERMQVVHRDMSMEERQRLKEQADSLARLIEDLESGKIHLEDIDPEIWSRFAKIVFRSKDGDS